MNGLALRINPKGNTKMKHPINFAPITFSLPENKDFNDELYTDFLKATTSDDQLQIIKDILARKLENHASFVSLVFLRAEVKHPVKGFLTRFVTKNIWLQKPFSEHLSRYIKSYTEDVHSDCRSYVLAVLQIAACIENFPAGAAAVMLVEIELAEYLIICLECCVMTLKSIKKLAPTEKNEIFSLTHLSLRLILYIVQKINVDNSAKLISMFVRIRLCITDLLFDEDAPMDTKSISAILYLSMGIMEEGPDMWIKILDPDQSDSNISMILTNESAVLAMYFALATVVSGDELCRSHIHGESAIICLIDRIITIGERNSSESIFTLGVTRAIVQMSRILEKTEDRDLGMKLLHRVLGFVWGHLDHHMDSVRHLAGQALTRVVGFCTMRHSQGDSEALKSLLDGIQALGVHRRGYFVCVCALAGFASPHSLQTLEALPKLLALPNLLTALHDQHVQASATTALETLLKNCKWESDPSKLYYQWVTPILHHAHTRQLDSSVLNILETLLIKVVQIHESIINYIVPHIRELSETDSPTSANLKCILLLLSVVRKSRWAQLSPADLLDYRVLRLAAGHSDEEIRILSLSLVVDSTKTTEVFSSEDLEFVLYFLRYNCNTQAPHFRQLTLALMHKFLKRLEDSHKVLLRQNEPDDPVNRGEYYLSFVEQLREQCFASLLRGANYSRRRLALAVLAHCHDLQLQGYESTWKEDYVEKLLQHFEDTYENNKALALQILEKCPVDLVKNKKYSVSLEVDDIFSQLTSLKPIDSVSASYKLMYLQSKLPERIVEGMSCEVSVEPVRYCLWKRLLQSLRSLLALGGVAQCAAAGGPHGALHCLRTLLPPPSTALAISTEPLWSELVREVMEVCYEVSECAEPVVCSSSPEGHLPMDHIIHEDHLVLEGGQPVTSQMVLLCAWRAVKEVSLLLGTICSRLTITGEGVEEGTLDWRQVLGVGRHLSRLLATTKHRGAFEQAYVGFTYLLERLWRCRSEKLHGRPKRWLRRLTAGVAKPQASATRRSAGLPYMIQALVITELQVQGNPKCLHECMTTLLNLAQAKTQQTPTFEDSDQEDSDDESILTAGPDKVASEMVVSEDNLVESRTHSLNILRALFRNSVLEESVSGFVGDGIKVALMGFDGDTWMERNSATLLFSALMSRVFGPRKTPTANRRMTGRIFFLRYPQLYDFILDKLEQVDRCSHVGEASWLPGVLVVLGRLYPSALEGAHSALRLAALRRPLLACSRAASVPTRILAAEAVIPLISPQQYLSHLEAMLSIICDHTVKRNYCHGILLQLTRLLAVRPEEIEISRDTNKVLMGILKKTFWIFKQGVCETPCYIILDEYVKMLNIIVWKFPTLVDQEMLEEMNELLQIILYSGRKSVTIGRDIALANVMYLKIVVLVQLDYIDDIIVNIFGCLEHRSYEVVISALNCLLIAHKRLEIDNSFLTHLSTFNYDKVLSKLRENDSYYERLCSVIKCSKYIECVQKSLKLLSLENCTQKYIVSIKLGRNPTEITDKDIVAELFDCVQNEHENLTHIYLESLSNFIYEKLKGSDLSELTLLEALRIIFACSTPDNNDNTRIVVATFLERNFERLISMNLIELSDPEKFEFKATIIASLVAILEDDEGNIRQKAADVVSRVWGDGGRVPGHKGPSAAADLLRDAIVRDKDGLPLLIMLALLDFKAVVCLTDETTDECKVFDQNEKYNIFLEESVWASECADKIVVLADKRNALQCVEETVESPAYSPTLHKLCNANLLLFKEKVESNSIRSVEIVNPKIEIFVSKLKSI